MSRFKILVDISLVLLYITVMIKGFILLGFTLSQATTSVAFIVGAIIITTVICLEKSK